MQALIHGNFVGDAQRKVYALVGAAAAIAAAVGPLLGGFITTLLSWRVGFALEVVVIAIVLFNIGLVRDVPYTGARGIDIVGAALSVIGMGGDRPGGPRLAGGRRVRRRADRGRALRTRLARLLACAVASGWQKPALIDPELFRSKGFRLGITGHTLAQIALGGCMIALPIYLQMVFEYNALQAGLSLAPLSLSTFAVALLDGAQGRRPVDRAPSSGSASASLSSGS